MQKITSRIAKKLWNLNPLPEREYPHLFAISPTGGVDRY
jgi:hypothetical protein